MQLIFGKNDLDSNLHPSRKEKKLDFSGIELGTFGFESQNATPKPPGLSYKEPSNCTYNNYSTKSEEQFG